MAKSKFTTLVVCFHLRLALDCSECGRIFLSAYLHTLGCLSGSLFQLDFQKHTVPILLSCFLRVSESLPVRPAASFREQQHHSALNGLSVPMFYLFLLEKKASLKMTHTYQEECRISLRCIDLRSESLEACLLSPN